jgi:hypothetical protein
MPRKRDWWGLTDATADRYAARGITKERYESGMPLKKPTGTTRAEARALLRAVAREYGEDMSTADSEINLALRDHSFDDIKYTVMAMDKARDWERRGRHDYAVAIRDYVYQPSLPIWIFHYGEPV